MQSDSVSFNGYAEMCVINCVINCDEQAIVNERFTLLLNMPVHESSYGVVSLK